MTVTVSRRIVTILIAFILLITLAFISADKVSAASKSYPKVKSLKAVNITYKSAVLKWKKPSSKVKGYVVKVYKYDYSKKSYTYLREKKLPKNNTRYSAGSLTMNNKYKFKVYASYSGGGRADPHL